ncbi:MAG: LysM peptidoglycan-binding domain-containing protein, partial [Chloroflexota bacterium]
AASMLLLPALVVGQEATPTVPPGITIYVVQRGDTLSKIAENLGTTTGTLVRLNNIADASNIDVGQRLLVPTAGDMPSAAPTIMHVVQPGESLESIAGLYGLSANELRIRNQITELSDFYVGLLLDVSAQAAANIPTDAPAAVDTPTDTPPTEVASNAITSDGAPAAVVVHVVQRGQTLFRIAQQYGVTVNDLATINHLADPTLIYAGQELIIPGFEPPQLALDMPAPVLSLDVTPLVFIEGEAGRIRLTTASPVSVAGTFINQTLNDAAETSNTRHTILVGVPVGTAAEVYPLDLVLTDEAGSQIPLSVNIQVVSGHYRRESITLLADRANLLNPTMEDAELTHLRNVTSVFTPTRYFDGAMGLPAASPLSSPFGSTRSYNGGEFSRIHTGTDFAAASGTPILAPAAGVVVYVGALDVRGNVTIIDHGWGVFTVYCHQTEQYVSVGDVITTRQVIGITGSTGRVTGAHLHWELWVDGVAVDAMQWVRQSFS